jgi:inner membrane protein involved in colicin E2 resistance
MGGFKRIIGIAFVFMMTTISWLVLGGVTSSRSGDQRHELTEAVQDLWGSPQTQVAPKLAFEWKTIREQKRTENTSTGTNEIVELVEEQHSEPVLLDASTLDVALHSDLRRKGLHWYSLYDVKLAGQYRYEHTRDQAGVLDLSFELPAREGVYDALVFTVNGQDFARALDSENNRLHARVNVAPGEVMAIAIGYGSRGLDEWRYAPTAGVGRLENFSLDLHTDFSDIDYPAGTMSPSKSVKRPDGGMDLSWKFDSLVTGHGIGMITPTRVQPGELATELSFSAPISLFFFFLVIYVLATIRGIDIHPMNYFLVAGAFFAFHLLFAYSADHLSVEWAFALCSVVSVALVVSYLRLVVSAKFALREAAIAQVIYLVGFSLAHFWEGFTGLTVTVLAIVTLFLLMQLTGRVKWSELLSSGAARRAAPAGATSAPLGG